jgi:hypothetical protein
MHQIKVLIFTTQLIAVGIFLASRDPEQTRIWSHLSVWSWIHQPEIPLGILLIGFGLLAGFIALLRKD